MSTFGLLSKPQNWMSKYVSTAGVKSTDSHAKTRAIRICNLMVISAMINTLVFTILFWFLGDQILFLNCILINIIYLSTHLLTVSGFPLIGRIALILIGNIVIFYFSSIFRGEALSQMIFYSLIISPFLIFSWEEKKYYSLILFSIVLFCLGEFHAWSFFEAHPIHYDLRFVRVFALLAPIHQIILGFYYFFQQSVKFESENQINLEKIEIEHQKQIQVQKMSSLGEMAAGASHEINNPLMIIIGRTYNLKRELAKKLPPDDVTFNNLDRIDSMVHRISNIIKALRNFSRNADLDASELVKFHTILESTLDLCRERFSSAGIHLHIDAPEQIEINCRPTEISQVLLNLLNNAFDATDKMTNAQVNVRVWKSLNQILINIEDNGPGIHPAIVDKIMQPFFTTKEIGKGTGLGLSLSKGLIESHKGSLTFIPHPQLTIFQIKLPIPEAPLNEGAF